MDIDNKTDITLQSTEVLDALVTTERGTITEADIQESIQAYAAKLPNPEELYNNKSMQFNGLLRHLYNTKIKYILPNTHNHDYKLLDDIFMNIYIPLSMMYNRVPTVNTFCNHLVNIYIDSVYDIRTGSFRPDYKYKVKPEIQSLIAKWDEICNGELVDYIVHNNSIGGIFRAKTKGFREEQTIKLEIANDTPTLDVKQITQGIDSNTPLLPD